MIVGLVLGSSIFGAPTAAVIEHGASLTIGKDEDARSTLDQPVILPSQSAPPLGSTLEPQSATRPDTGATLEDNHTNVGATLS